MAEILAGIRVSREAGVPPRRQVAAALEAAIRSGRLAPGEPLPATRPAARRLGLHRNTVAAAYRELAARGLVRLARGQRARVRAGSGPAAPPWSASGGRRWSGPPPAGARVWGGPPPLPASSALPPLRPLPAPRVAEEARRWADAVLRPPVLVEPCTGLREAMRLELAAAGVRVRPLSPLAYRRAVRAAAAGAAPPGIAVARPAVAQRLRPRLPAWCEVAEVEPAAGWRWRDRSGRDGGPELVAVVTGSPLVRRRARELAAAAGGGMVVTTPRPEDEAALRRVRELASLVLVDAACGALPELAGCAWVRGFRVVCPSSAEALRAYLGGCGAAASGREAESPGGRGEVAMKVQVVRASVAEERRGRYLAAWAEWSGALLGMGIRTELLEREAELGEFLEITRFPPGQEAALADDRLTRLEAELDAAASAREGSLRLYRPREAVRSPSEGG